MLRDPPPKRITIKEFGVQVKVAQRSVERSGDCGLSRT
jgi:hypothetical protein